MSMKPKQRKHYTKGTPKQKQLEICERLHRGEKEVEIAKSLGCSRQNIQLTIKTWYETIYGEPYTHSNKLERLKQENYNRFIELAEKTSHRLSFNAMCKTLKIKSPQLFKAFQKKQGYKYEQARLSSLTFCINREQLAAIEEFAKNKNETRSEILRQAVKEFLDKYNCE